MSKNRITDINDFLAQKKLAVVGASRSQNKFGNVVFRELKQRNYQVFPINSQAKTIEGVPCWPDLKSLPEPVDGAVFVVPPAVTEHVVKDAKEAGIPRIWMQYGSHSQDAVDFCKENNMTVVANECIMMFAEPVGSFHKFHRWLWKLFRIYPK